MIHLINVLTSGTFIEFDELPSVNAQHVNFAFFEYSKSKF